MSSTEPTTTTADEMAALTTAVRRLRIVREPIKAAAEAIGEMAAATAPSLYDRITTHYNATVAPLDDSTLGGGAIRSGRGELVEGMIDIICQDIGLLSKKGTTDMQTITINRAGKVFSLEHQVDRHIYKGDTLIAIVECKAYLDSCYYVRACSDFKRMKIAHPDIKCYIFALENSISESSKVFTDVETDDVCDGVFYMCDGKRSSSKPIYKKEFYKTINETSFNAFVDTMKSLLL
jgi:hypothetical protein